MFEGQPKGLYALALANTGERFGYYTMLAVFTLFLMDNFGWSQGVAGVWYAVFLALVYFLPLVGGIVADKIGFGKCVTTGIIVMFLGYLLLSIPAGSGIVAVGIMALALLMVCVGTSLFKGNLQVMVGNLYDDPKLESKRDSAFSIFYMAINIGALFAPSAAVEIMRYVESNLGVSRADAYHYAFGVACLSLILSIIIITPSAVRSSTPITTRRLRQPVRPPSLPNFRPARRRTVSWRSASSLPWSSFSGWRSIRTVRR